MEKNPVHRVNPSIWEKRVKNEYARLQKEKNSRQRDDVRLAWTENRQRMQNFETNK